MEFYDFIKYPVKQERRNRNMKMKKVVALLLASAMTLSMAITSFAADTDPSKNDPVPTPTPTATPTPEAVKPSTGTAEDNSGVVKVGNDEYYIGATTDQKEIINALPEEYKAVVENVIKTDETIKQALADPTQLPGVQLEKEVKADDIKVLFTADYVLKDAAGNVVEGDDLAAVLAEGPITFDLDEAIEAPGEGEALYALHFVSSTGEWEILHATLGADGKTVSVSVDSLSPFTVFVGPTGLVSVAGVEPTPTPTVTTTPAPGQKPPTYHEPPKHAYDPDAAIKDDSTDKGNSNTNTNTNNKNNSATTSTSTTSAAKVSPKTGQR